MKKFLTYLFCFVFLIIATDCYRYVFWSSILPPAYHIDDFFYIAVILYGWLCANDVGTSNIWGGRYIKISIILMLVSELIKPFIIDQVSLSQISQTLSNCAGLSTLFIFYRQSVDIKHVIIAIVIFAAVGFIIQYGENYLDFPVLFGIGDLTDELKSRYDTEFGVISGINVCSQLLPVFCIWVFWRNYVETGKWINLLPFAVFVVFLYLMQNRQTLVSVIATFAMTPLLTSQRRTKKITILVMMIAASALLVEYWDVLFGSMVEKTRNNTNSWDTRMVEIPYYLSESINNPITFLLGHGRQSVYPTYQGFLMCCSDVGFVGKLYEYGIFFVLQYFLFLWCVVKERRTLPLLTKLFVCSTAIHSLFIFPYTSSLPSFLWSMAIYYANCRMVTTENINDFGISSKLNTI